MEDSAPASLDVYKAAREINCNNLSFSIGKKKEGRGRPIFVKESGRSIFFRLGAWSPTIASTNPEERMMAISRLVTVTSPFHMNRIDQDGKQKDASLVYIDSPDPADIAKLEELYEKYVDYIFENQKEIYGEKHKPLGRDIIASKVKPLVEENNGRKVIRVKLHYEGGPRSTQVYQQTSRLTEMVASTVQKIPMNQPACIGVRGGGMTVLSEFIAPTLDACLYGGAFFDSDEQARNPTALFAGMTFVNANTTPGAVTAGDDAAMDIGSGMSTVGGEEDDYTGNINA